MRKLVFTCCIFIISISLIHAHRPKIRPISDYFKGFAQSEEFLMDAPKEILAKVNGKEIKRNDYLEWLVDQSDEQIFNHFLTDTLISQKAEKLKITTPEKDIYMKVRDKVEESVRRLYFSTEAYRNELRPVLKEKFLKEVRKYYQLSMILLEETNFSEERLEREFKEKFGKYGKKYWLRFLYYVPNKYYMRKGQEGYKEAVAKREDEAKKNLSKVLEKIKQSKKIDEEFDDLAYIYSQDESSRNNGGYIGRFVKGQYGGEFDTVVPTLKKNDISSVLKSRKGFHIVRVMNKTKNDITISHIFNKVNYFSIIDETKWNEARSNAMKERGEVLKKVEFGQSLLTDRELKSLNRSFGFDDEPGWENSWDMIFGQKLNTLKKSENSDFIEIDKGLFVFRVANVREKKFDDETKALLKKDICYRLAQLKYDEYIADLFEKAKVVKYF